MSHVMLWPVPVVMPVRSPVTFVTGWLKPSTPPSFERDTVMSQGPFGASSS